MNIHTIIIYIISSIVLGIILNILENKKEDNFLDYIIISNIYILLLASFFKNHSNNIFLIVLFQTISNILYITYIKELPFFNNNKYNILKYIFNIISTYLLNIFFINKVNTVLINPEQAKLVIWILIIGYIYLNLKDNIKLNKIKENKKLFYQDQEYIVMQYAKFKSKYYKEIKTKNKELIPIIYSIMIYENYHKSKILRKLDKYKIFNKQNKYGIMQVVSNKYIDDITSIKIAIKSLEQIFKEKNNPKDIINEYYNKQNKEVFSIYKEIINFDKK